MTRPAHTTPRIHLLEDALHSLAQVHGPDVLLDPVAVPPGTREVVRAAVRNSERRAEALTKARAEATR